MAQRRLGRSVEVGGHRELITDGDTGTLFAPDDPAACAAALAACSIRAGRGAMKGSRTSPMSARDTIGPRMPAII